MKRIKNGLNKNKKPIICKSVLFYSQKDEAAFFEWIKKIDCIDNISGAGNELYLHVASVILHDYDLRELVALFKRYNINMKQLKIFLNEDNKKWFQNKTAYWYKKVFQV